MFAVSASDTIYDTAHMTMDEIVGSADKKEMTIDEIVATADKEHVADDGKTSWEIEHTASTAEELVVESSSSAEETDGAALEPATKRARLAIGNAVLRMVDSVTGKCNRRNQVRMPDASDCDGQTHVEEQPTVTETSSEVITAPASSSREAMKSNLYKVLGSCPTRSGGRDKVKRTLKELVAQGLSAGDIMAHTSVLALSATADASGVNLWDLLEEVEEETFTFV